MLSGPSAGNVLCGHYNNVSFDVGKSMPRREQIVKVSFDVGEARLTSEQQMELIRMKMLEMRYRRWYSKGLESFHTFSPDTSGSCVPMQSADFASMLGEIWSEDDNLQLHATTLIKKFLSIEGNCPTTLVKSGVIGRFAHFLMRNDFLQLQYEAAWALIKIACGTSGKTKTEFVCEAVPYFVRLLDSPSYDACELGVFSLGIVAHDSRNDRDFVLSNEVLVPLLKLLEKHAFLGNQANLSMLRNVTWTLSIFCRDISERHYKQVKPALTTLGRLLHSDDEEVLINSCWAIHGLFYEGFGKIQALMGAGLCPKLVKHLLHSSRRVQIPVLMTVGLISSEKTHIQALIKNGTLGPLLTLLTEGPKAEDPQDGDRLIKTDACAVISGILRGKERQIQAVIDANFFGPLVKHLESPDLDLQEEAARAISFAISYGSRMQIEYLVNEWKIINHISNLLTCENNPTAVQLALKVVKDLLEAGSSKQDLGSSPYAQLIAEAQCVEKMKLILEEQWRFNHEIVWEAKFILMDFFKDVLGMGGKNSY